MSTAEETRPTTVQPVTRRDVLHRAADLLEEFGWCQGHEAKSVDGRSVRFHDCEAVAFCAGGSVDRACFDLGIPEWQYQQIADLLGERYTDWNDDNERTKAEVVARLREAAEVSA